MVPRRLVRWIRALPIASRIPLVVALNLFIALAVGGVGWRAAAVMSDDIDDLRQVQRGTVALADINDRASRMQGLVRQYLNNPNDDLLKQTMRASEELFVAMGDPVVCPTPFNDDVAAMHEAARRFVSGFQTLKMINADIARLYESQVHQTIGEISGLYAILNATARTRGGGDVAPALIKSHETFVGVLIAVNAFSFDGNQARADEARAGLARMAESLPGLIRLASGDLQRDALAMLGMRVRSLTAAIDEVARNYDARGRVLFEEIDTSQEAMSAAIDRLISDSRAREDALRHRSRNRLTRMAMAGAAGAVGLLLLGAWISVMIGQSIRRPLLELREVMEAGARGDWSRAVADSDLNDELAAMARTIEVFRRQASETSRLESERSRAEFDAGIADRQSLRDLLVRIEAHDGAGPFVAPGNAAPDSLEAEVVAVFNRVLSRFHAAVADGDASIRAVTEQREAARALARSRSEFLIALIPALRPLLDGLGAPAWTALCRLDAALEYARLEAGETAPVPCAIELASVARAAATFARAGAGTVRIEIGLDPGLPPMLRIDPVWLARLLGLLLDHAQGTARRRVRLFAERQGIGNPFLRLWAASDGEPAFTWGDALSRPTPQSDAADLGLALIRRLADRLGGRIDGVASSGLGHALWCDLPLDPAVGGCPLRSGSDCLIGLRVLVVAPDPDERGLISLVAEQAGGAVVRVPGGREALAASARAAATRAPFDLVVAASRGIDPDQFAALGAVPLVLIDDGDPVRRLALSWGEACPVVIGRPLVRDQILAAMAAAARDKLTFDPASPCR